MAAIHGSLIPGICREVLLVQNFWFHPHQERGEKMHWRKDCRARVSTNIKVKDEDPDIQEFGFHEQDHTRPPEEAMVSRA